MKIKPAKVAKRAVKTVINIVLLIVGSIVAVACLLPIAWYYGLIGVKLPYHAVRWYFATRRVVVYKFGRRKGGPSVEMPMVKARAKVIESPQRQDCMQVVLDDLQKVVDADPDSKFVVPELYQWYQPEKIEIRKHDGTRCNPPQYMWGRKYTCEPVRKATSVERDMYVPLVALGPIGLLRRLVIWPLYVKLSETQQQTVQPAEAIAA